MKLEDLKKNLGQNRMDESQIEEVLENDKNNNCLIDRLYKAVIVAEVIAMNQERLPKNIETDKECEMHSALNSIFRMMHTATIPRCMDSHPKWEEEFQNAVERYGIDERAPINEWKRPHPEEPGLYLLTVKCSDKDEHMLFYHPDKDRKVIEAEYKEDGEWYKNGLSIDFHEIIAYKNKPKPSKKY